jgi:hypothetical protein
LPNRIPPAGEIFNKGEMNMKPVARRNNLVVQRDTGELFIEDLLNRKQIKLNPTSAYVWEKCDGRHETYEIAEEMESELGVSVSESVVLMAINRLYSEKLLEPVNQFA